jgi:ATP-dependent Clp protease ATP-binding subunit ClpX
LRQNGEKMSENNDTINNQEEEYEKICYICRRPESKAGKMIAMPGNVYVCQDCLQKTFDTINNSGMNYDENERDAEYGNVWQYELSGYGYTGKSENKEKEKGKETGRKTGFTQHSGAARN